MPDSPSDAPGGASSERGRSPDNGSFFIQNDVNKSAQLPPPGPSPAFADCPRDLARRIDRAAFPKPPPHRRKAEVTFRTNARAFVNHYGVNHCGFATLLFDKEINSKEAQACLQSAKYLLEKLFVDYIRVLDFTQEGIPHFHLLTASESDIRSGFNEEAYFEISRLKKQFSFTGGPVNSTERDYYLGLFQKLNPNTHLQAVHRELLKLPKYGFGEHYPAHFAPLLKPKGVIRYLAGKFSIDLKAQRLYVKGTRSVAYAKYSPARKAWATFGWNGPYTQLNRVKKGAVAAALGVDEPWFRQWWGSHWNRPLEERIARLDQQCPGWYEMPVDEVQGLVRNIVFEGVSFWNRPR